MYQPEQDFTGRYTLKERIGVGGFAEVWRAYDHTTKTDIALKILAPDTNLNREVIDQCSQEYTKTLKIQHSHLLTPNYFGIERGQMYFIMPLCKAGSLGKRLYQSPLTEAEVWQVVKQVGQGLAYLHEHDLLHNDVKPDNILIAANKSYVLTDFGVSTRTRTTLRRYTRGQSQEAVAGLSVAYAAPELFGSQPGQSKATDIFSFGIMLYELVTGDLPFLGQGGIFLKNGADLPALPAGFSAKLQNLVHACLALDPHKRPTAEELADYKDESERKAAYQKLFIAFYEDGKISKRERELLLDKQKELRLNDADVKQIEEFIQSGHKKKSPLVWIIVAILILAAGVWGYNAYQNYQADQQLTPKVDNQTDSKSTVVDNRMGDKPIEKQTPKPRKVKPKPTSPKIEAVKKSKPTRKDCENLRKKVKEYTLNKPYNQQTSKSLELLLKQSGCASNKLQPLQDLLKRHKTYSKRYNRYKKGEDFESFGHDNYYKQLWQEDEASKK